MTKRGSRHILARLWALPWFVRWTAIAGFVVVIVAAFPYGWTRIEASGHQYDETDRTATASVLLVLGAEVDGSEPKPFLKGRLDTAARLIRDGRARVALVSGDAAGGSGNETSVMAAYLARVGVAPGRVVIDPYGLDTYDSCLRARQVYGVTRALVVTQDYHLARAVTLCRHVGIDADGVRARCDGCGINIPRNWVRDYFACGKAVWDTIRDRPPVVTSAPDPAVTDALART